MDGASAAALHARAQRSRREDRPELAILVVADRRGEDLRQLAVRTYLAWGLGSSRVDDGLLLVVDPASGEWLLQPGVAVATSVASPWLLDRIDGRLREGLAAGALGPALVAVSEQLAGAARFGPPAAPAGPVVKERSGPRPDRGTDALRLALLLLSGVTLASALALQGRLRPRGEPRPTTAQGWRLRAEAHGQRLVVRTATPGVLLLLGSMALAAAASALAAVDGAGRPPERLTCSRDTGRCLLTDAGEEVAWVSLDATARFTSTASGKNRAARLLAVTPWGNATLVAGWPDAALRQHARDLDAFLAGRRGRELSFEHDRSAGSYALALAMGGLVAILSLSIWLFTGPWRLTLDRGAGHATLGRPLRRARWPLSRVVGVQVWTGRDEQVERARRTRRPVPYAGPVEARRRLVLLLEGDAWRPVTPWVAKGPADEALPVVAGQVAAHLGVPLLPAPPEPPAGSVPPADWAKVTPPSSPRT